MTEVCRESYSIANIFFTLFPVTLFEYIATRSEKYEYQYKVTPREVEHHDGNVSKKKKLLPCAANDPHRRHKNTEGYHFTCGYIIC